VPRPTGAKRLKSITAAAEYADLSQWTIRRYVADGRLTGYRIDPRLIKIDLNEIDQLARPVAAAGDGR
jgi:excisionase family DNA binding protein